MAKTGDSNDRDRTIFCAQLDDDVTKELLYELFIQAGPVENVVRPEGKTFAFVTFRQSQSASYAKELLQGVTLNGNQLVIKFRRGSLLEAGPEISYQEKEKTRQRHIYEATLRGPQQNKKRVLGQGCYVGQSVQVGVSMPTTSTMGYPDLVRQVALSQHKRSHSTPDFRQYYGANPGLQSRRQYYSASPYPRPAQVAYGNGVRYYQQRGQFQMFGYY